MKNIIITLTMGILTILVPIFIVVIQLMPNFLINKTINKMKEYYIYYSYLNPSTHINKRIEVKNRLITYRLKKQGLFFYGMPDGYWNFTFEKYDYSFNPFKIIDDFKSKKIPFKQILKIYKFWSKCLKKIKWISEIIKNKNYIVFELSPINSSYGWKDKNHSTRFIDFIDETSISLIPSEDKLKLFGNNENVENSKNIHSIEEKNKIENKKLVQVLKELRDNTFSINIKFNTPIEFLNEFIDCSYSVLFKGNKVKEILWFVNKLNVNKMINSHKKFFYSEKFKNQIETVSRFFEIKNISLFKLLDEIVDENYYNELSKMIIEDE